MDEKNNTIVPFFEPLTETVTVTKIGGTYYEVTTHFNTEGRETVLQQFLDILKSEEII